MKKHAIDPLTVAGIGLLSHVGTNAAVKGLTSLGRKAPKGKLLSRLSKIFPSWRRKTMGEGIRRGISGKATPISQRIGETWVAPEVYEGAHVGKSIGESIKGMSKGRRYQVLKKLRKEVAMTPELKNTPIFEDVVGGINHALKGKLPNPGLAQADSLAQKVVPKVVGVGASIVKPPGLVHAGINRARVATANSSVGRTYLKNQAKDGVLRGVGAKAPSSKAVDVARDFILSPAAADPQKITNALTQLTIKNPKRAKRVAGAIYQVGRPSINNKINTPLNKLLQKHTDALLGQGRPSPPTPTPFRPVSPSHSRVLAK